MNYGLNYFEHTLRKMSMTAEDICQRRWKFITPTKAIRILDYGCGVGWFRAFKPDKNLIVDTYDVGNYPQTGINEMEYDLICFWDSLEHIPNLDEINWLLTRTEFVAISIPIFLGDMQQEEFRKWKHYRPNEHLHYFTLQTLANFFEERGFEMFEKNQNECPPREDVWSILYRRKRNAS